MIGLKFLAKDLFSLYYYFRKDFRPCYGGLGVSGSLFPGVPILALTATSSTQIKKLHQLRERKKLHQLRERKKLHQQNK
jgi:superfamily II DNA helicase RecQ